MHRTLAPMLALLCVLGAALVPVAGLAGTDGPPGEPADSRSSAALSPPEQTNGSVARMVVDQAHRTGRGAVAPNLTSSLSTSTRSVGERIGTLTLTEQFDALESTAERRALLDRALIGVNARADQLHRRHRTALAGYSNGSLTEAELLRTLAEIDENARYLDDRLSRIDRLAERADAEYLLSRVIRIRYQLRALQNDLQEHVSTSVFTGIQSPEIHVETTDDAVVIAAIIDGEYVRASYFHANRQTSGPLELDTSGEALQQAEAYYPWAWDSEHSNQVGGQRYETTFVANSYHQHGKLTAYLDMHSGAVYKEVHELQLSEIPTTSGPETVNTRYRVVLERTYPGGPMRVDVYDTTTDERVRARVSLNNGSFLPTGEDGGRWFVEPRLTSDADSYTVRVVVNSQSLTLLVTGADQDAAAYGNARSN